MKTTVLKFKPPASRDGGYIRRLFCMLILVFLFLCLVKGKQFLTVSNFESMAFQFPEFGLMALGVMMAMITGGIDLSSVGVANMTSIVAATMMTSFLKANANASPLSAILLALAAALLIGILSGLFNGVMIAFFNIPPILATLGAMELYLGIGLIVSRGKTVSGLPDAYSQILTGKFLGIPAPLVLFLIAAVATAFLLNRTTFGAKIYLLGTNPSAARFSGLNNERLIVGTYIYSAILSTVAGFIMMANYNSAKADYGTSYTLQSILIAILGGVSPTGGEGRVLGVVCAVIILQFLSSGLNMYRQINNFYKLLIWGLVLLTVMLYNHVRSQHQGQRNSGKHA